MHWHKAMCINIQKVPSCSVVSGLKILWNKVTVKKLAMMHPALKCSRKPQIGRWHTLTFNPPLIWASACDYRCQSPETQWCLSFLLPTLTLSDTFYDSPSYCSEMDKNNMLMWPAGVSSGEVLGALGSGGSGWLPKHRKAARCIVTVRGCQGWTLVFPLRPSPSTLSINNRSTESSQLTRPLWWAGWADRSKGMLVQSYSSVNVLLVL